jgi:uncharacterized protein YbaP (TraB family)
MTRRLAIAFAALCCFAAAACGPTDRSDFPPAKPALWEVQGPEGETAWLFGTVHQLPEDREWRTPLLRKRLGKADMLVLETRDVGDQKKLRAVFERLSRTSSLPPLGQRIAPESRTALKGLMKRAGLSDSDFAGIETWAAALILAQAAQEEPSGHGVDEGLLGLRKGLPVEELEGTVAQLGIFDRLPEQDQRDLLAAIVREAPGASTKSRELADFWARGDMNSIAKETHQGMLADPELRAVLLVGRNCVWVAKIEALLRSGRHPFVAAGAAHMAGEEGLPALLADRGWTVTRIQ